MDNDDNILFTSGAYYKILSYAAHEVRVDPTPSKLASLHKVNLTKHLTTSCCAMSGK
jgi:hypothetical protein